MNKEFLWGSATAAYQCEGGWKEGGKGLSNWDVFCHSKKNSVNPVTGDVACDFYHHYEEDIRMLAEGGQNAYRFSIAWTRILPDGTGRKSQEGIDFYHRVIDTCRKYHVEPLVTLYHYDLPESIYEAGGWENRNIVEQFVEYARICFEEYGQKVNYWVTINEPNYETLCCYGFGNYPPNVKDLSRRWRAMHHMLLASARAVAVFRELKLPGMVGLVSDSYPIAVLTDNEAHRKAAHMADLFFNLCVNDVCVKGAYPQDFVDQLKKDGYDLSYMKEEDPSIFADGCVDYLGINAYNRYIAEPADGPETNLGVNNTGDGKKTKFQIGNWFSLGEDSEMEKTPWGMEINPRSIYDLLMDLKRLYPQIPVIITENGVGNYDEVVDGQIHDQYRIAYLEGYVDWIERAMEDGCTVLGYFVWSTMDVYSWINGYKKRYGLIYIDYDSDDLVRIPKDSYYWYKNKIQNRRKSFNGKIHSIY